MFRIFSILLLLVSSAFAQPAMVPLTDWRAQIDNDLGKIPMTREAHGQVIAILQAYERASQQEKMKVLEHQLPPRQPPQIPAPLPPAAPKEEPK